MPTHGADAGALKLWERHYSKRWYADGRFVTKFTGPGEHIVLVLPDYSALFVWCHNTIERMDKQVGVNCAVFRNESNYLSSDLIVEAQEWAWDRWPGKRLFTYVNSNKIKSTNPGYCFIKAGWNRCGVSKVNKLVILERQPHNKGINEDA